MLSVQTAHDGVRMGILNATYCFIKRAAWPHDSVTGAALWTHPSREDMTHCDAERSLGSRLAGLAHVLKTLEQGRIGRPCGSV
jgi:hypothetical protein